MGPLVSTRTVRGRRSRPNRHPGHKALLFLAALPVLDPVINQINGIHPVSIGPLSILQVLRGAVLMLALGMTVMAPHTLSGPAKVVRRVAIAIGLCLCIFAFHESFAWGALPLGSLVAYSQIVYWLVMWTLAAAWIADARQARMVITGLVAGAVVTAGSVLYGYVIGVTTVYSAQGVSASAGWFTSGKGISGTLLSGALLAAYLGRNGNWWPTLLALVCLGASFLTYARAGMVALAVTLCWLLFWTVKTRSTGTSAWARRLILCAACAVAVVVFAVGTTDLTQRWSDVGNPSQAGSGRLVIWRAALDSFLGGGASEQMLGRGYTGMVELINMAIGLPIHTHNDVLDMLTVGGILGLCVLALLAVGLIAQVRTVPIAAPEFAVAIALLLVLWCQGFFTGQMFMPDIMTFYLLGISAVLAHADAPRPRRRRPSVDAEPEPLRMDGLRRRIAELPRV